MTCYGVSHLADHVLLRDLAATVSQDRATTARMLALLAEADARKLYAPAGYPSMYAWCVGELRFSEDAAYKRIRAARTASRHPEILPAIEHGSLAFSGAVLLAPHLTRENACDLLSAAAHKTNHGIELMLAERFPQPDLARLLQPISSQPATPVCASDPGRLPEAPLVQPPSCQLAVRPVAGSVPQAVAPSPAPPPAQTPPARPRVTPLAPRRFALQVTLDQGTHDKLRRVQELLGHAIPSGDLARVLDRALELALRHLEHARFAKCEKPRAQRHDAKGRRIPAAIKREVWQRDGGRCTCAGTNGRRCEARARLEYDHATPLARGGRTCAANLRLRCRAHNQMAAEQVLGKGFMDARREAARRARSSASATRARSQSPGRSRPHSSEGTPHAGALPWPATTPPP